MPPRGPPDLAAGVRGPLRIEDLRIRARLRILLRVREVQALQPGSLVPLAVAVLVAGEGAGAPVADVKLEGTPESGIRARVVRAHPSPVEALLGGALPDKGAVPAVTRSAPVVARTKYAMVRGAEEAAAAAAPAPLSRHAVAVTRLRRIAAQALVQAARAPEFVEDGTLQALRETDRWIEGLVALGRPGTPTKGRGGFDPWFDSFVGDWLDPLLDGISDLMARAREGGAAAQGAQLAVALSALLAEELPDAFAEEGIALGVHRPLETMFDAETMRNVGRHPMPGFDGRVVSQRSAGVTRGGTMERAADVVVAG